MHGSAPWKTEETIVGMPRLLVLSAFSRFGGCHLSALLDGGYTSLVIQGSYAVACGMYGFAVFDYTTPAKPSVSTYVPTAANGNVNFQGPVVCGFDGSTAAFGDNSGNVYVFSIWGGAPHYTTTFLSGQQAVTSVAVMVNLVAANFIGSGYVTLVNLLPGAQSSPPTPTLINTGGGPNPGGPLKFLGLPDLAFGTNDGKGVMWLNTLNQATILPYRTASTAVLAPGSRPTIGFTGWPFPP